MVDAADSKSASARSAGSSPARGTKITNTNRKNNMTQYKIKNATLQDLDQLITMMKLYRNAELEPYLVSVSRTDNWYTITYCAAAPLVENSQIL
jgi:hypothetical protein